MKLDDFLISVGLRAKVLKALGLSLIALVSVWDLFLIGMRGFLEWRIAPGGILLIWFSIGLIFLAWRVDKYLRG